MYKSYHAAAMAPPSMIKKAKSTSLSTGLLKKKISPAVVKIFVTFLNTVTIGTLLCAKLAMLVNNIRQNKIFTGDHCNAVRKLNAGYSTHFIFFENSTHITAVIAWKTTRRIFSCPSIKWL